MVLLRTSPNTVRLLTLVESMVFFPFPVDMSWGSRPKRVQTVMFAMGDEIEVIILEFDQEEKVSLGWALTSTQSF